MPCLFPIRCAGTAEPLGYAVDSCKNLLQALQRDAQLPSLRTKYLQADNNERFAAVANGRLDLECADTTNTRGHRDQLGMAFSVPYCLAGTRVLVCADSKSRASRTWATRPS